MSLVGIIANPDSGKDIRRLVGHAVSVSNDQKQNIIKRLLVALCDSGVDQISIMPERFGFGRRCLNDLQDNRRVQSACDVMELLTLNTAEDTQRAVEWLREAGADCIVVLGGDGTSRVVSKYCGEIPLLPISTGTNNVVPSFVEGTVAGLAAAYLVQHKNVPRHELCCRHKRLVIVVNGEEVDQALVDVALINDAFVGSRAVWHVEDILEIFVTRAHPMNTGISSVIGMVSPLSPLAPQGATVKLDENGSKVLSTLVPGTLVECGIAEIVHMQPGKLYPLMTRRPAVLALDGEREIVLYEGWQAGVELRLDGPWLLDVEKIMLRAVEEGLFLQA